MTYNSPAQETRGSLWHVTIEPGTPRCWWLKLTGVAELQELNLTGCLRCFELTLAMIREDLPYYQKAHEDRKLLFQAMRGAHAHVVRLRSTWKKECMPSLVPFRIPSSNQGARMLHQPYIKHATLRLVQSSEDATLILDEGPTQVHASTSHSYQTLMSSVWRHMLTSNSVSAGK